MAFHCEENISVNNLDLIISENFINTFPRDPLKHPTTDLLLLLMVLFCELEHYKVYDRVYVRKVSLHVRKTDRNMSYFQMSEKPLNKGSTLHKKGR